LILEEYPGFSFDEIKKFSKEDFDYWFEASCHKRYRADVRRLDSAMLMISEDARKKELTRLKTLRDGMEYQTGDQLKDFEFANFAMVR
jgi:hypothetical protein